MPMRGISRFSGENLLSHSTEKLRGVTLLCFTKFLVWKKITDNSGGEGREYHDFLSKFFYHSAENLRWGPCSVSSIYGIEKFHAYEGNITIFWGNFVVSQYRKTLLGNPSMFYKVSGIENLWIRREDGGSITIFGQIFFVSQCRNFL